MTVLENVEILLARIVPQAICDDCVTEELGLSIRQHANHKTRALAKLPNFDRRKAACSLCGNVKLVIKTV